MCRLCSAFVGGAVRNMSVFCITFAVDNEIVITMRNRILAVLAALLTFGAVGSQAQMRRGASVGVDISTLTFKQDLISVDQTVRPAAGLQYELMFPGIGFGLDFGAFYAQRGATLHLGDRYIWSSDGFGNERAFLHYLHIPLHFRFKYTNLGGIEDVIGSVCLRRPGILDPVRPRIDQA